MAPASERLSWRVAPNNDELINLTIKIFLEGSCADDETNPPYAVYNVHKILMNFGPRRCGLFVETSVVNNTIRIELPQSLADVFPLLLDFIYGQLEPDTPLPIDTDTATALHSLGGRLLNSSLQSMVKKFVENDIKLENCHIYYEHALGLSNEGVLEMVVKACAKNMSSGKDAVYEQIPILENADTSFWLKVLQEINQNSSNGISSDWILEMIRHNIEGMTLEVFSQHFNNVIWSPYSEGLLLELEEEIVGNSNKSTNSKSEERVSSTLLDRMVPCVSKDEEKSKAYKKMVHLENRLLGELMFVHSGVYPQEYNDAREKVLGSNWNYILDRAERELEEPSDDPWESSTTAEEYLVSSGFWKQPIPEHIVELRPQASRE